MFLSWKLASCRADNESIESKANKKILHNIFFHSSDSVSKVEWYHDVLIDEINLWKMIDC